MDGARKSELWGEAVNAYNLLGMSGFESWTDNYEGDVDEKKFLRGICDYLHHENTRGERLFSLRGVSLELILGKVS